MCHISELCQANWKNDFLSDFGGGVFEKNETQIFLTCFWLSEVIWSVLHWNVEI